MFLHPGTTHELNVGLVMFENNLKGRYRPLSRCGHLDFTPIQLIITKLRLDEILVWCHVCAKNVSIHYCDRNREYDQDGDSVKKVYTIGKHTKNERQTN